VVVGDFDDVNIVNGTANEMRVKQRNICIESGAAATTVRMEA
jgi:hypothetical protein